MPVTKYTHSSFEMSAFSANKSKDKQSGEWNTWRQLM